MDKASDFHQNGRLPDYYGTLGVSDDASFRDIEQAYWRLAFSPEGRQRLAELNRAYEVLGSKDKREAYDALRRTHGRQAEKPSRTHQNGERPGHRPKLGW